MHSIPVPLTQSTDFALVSAYEYIVIQIKNNAEIRN